MRQRLEITLKNEKIRLMKQRLEITTFALPFIALGFFLLGLYMGLEGM